MSDKSDAGTVTNRRRQSRRMTCDRALHIFSSFLIPLLLSVFTICIAVYQQKVANDNRRMDMKIAEEQRSLDHELAKEQREADQNASVQQRQADRIDAEARRNLDIEIADTKRETDQNLSHLQRKQEFALEETRREIARQEKEEAILGTLIDESSDILWSSNNLSYNDKIFALRWRMLTALRQLNGKRKAFVLQFLLETGLILNKNSATEHDITPLLVWKFANFEHLDLSPNSLASTPHIQPLLLANCTAMINLIQLNFKNAIFDHISMQCIDFLRADLTNASFQHSHLIQVSFKQAKLIYSNFIGATVRDCDFTRVNLTGSTITEQQLAGEAHIEETILPDGKTMAFLDLLKEYRYDQQLGRWIEDTYVTNLWQIRQYSNNQPEAMIIQSFNAHRGWRLETRAVQYVGITRQVILPSRYKRKAYNQHSYLVPSIRCGKFMLYTNDSLLHPYDKRHAHIDVFINQYDYSHKIIATFKLYTFNLFGDHIKGHDAWSQDYSNTVYIHNNSTHYIDFVIDFQQLNPNEMGEPISYCENPKMIIRHAMAYDIEQTKLEKK